MALTEPRTWGYDVTLEIGSKSISEWLSVSFTDPDDHVEATAASATYEQYTEGRIVQREITITGYMGSIDDGNIPVKNDKVTALSVEVGGDEKMPDVSDTATYGEFYVAETSIDYGLDPLEWSITIRSGRIPTGNNDSGNGDS